MQLEQWAAARWWFCSRDPHRKSCRGCQYGLPSLQHTCYNDARAIIMLVKGFFHCLRGLKRALCYAHYSMTTWDSGWVNLTQRQKYSLTWRKRLVHSLIAADVVTRWVKGTHWLEAVHLSTGSFKRAKWVYEYKENQCKHQYTIHRSFIKSSITPVDLFCKAKQEINELYFI